MALAENHRTALKMEANCIAAAAAVSPGSSTSGTSAASTSETNEYAGFSTAATSESAGNRCGRSHHQYSDMLNQVYTSHLHAQLSNHHHHSSHHQAQPHGPHHPGQHQKMYHHGHQSFDDYGHLHQFDPGMAASLGFHSTASTASAKSEKQTNNNTIADDKDGRTYNYLPQLRAKCERKSELNKDIKKSNPKTEGKAEADGNRSSAAAAMQYAV